MWQNLLMISVPQPWQRSFGGPFGAAGDENVAATGAFLSDPACTRFPFSSIRRCRLMRIGSVGIGMGSVSGGARWTARGTLC